MRALLATVVAVTAGFVVAGCGGSSAKNAGLIAFISAKSGRQELYAVKPDGTGLKRLTNLDSVISFDWTADGHSLLLYGTKVHKGNGAVYTVRADGSGLHKLRLTSYPLAWSPDQKHILSQDEKGDLYVADADGSGRRPIADHSFFPAPAPWSPDGKSLLLIKTTKAGSELYVAGLDGRPPRLLTDNASFLASPSWSTDGKRVAFAWDGNPDKFELGGIETVASDGSGLRSVTTNGERQPVWSPDDTSLAVVNLHEIDVVAAASGRLGRLVQVPEPISLTAWSPDGSRFAYTTFSPHIQKSNKGYDKLYVVNADGTGHRLLADSMGIVDHFEWQPLTAGQIAAGRKLVAKLRPLPVTPDSWVGAFCRSTKRAVSQLTGIAPALRTFAAKLKRTGKLDLKAVRSLLSSVLASAGRALQTIHDAVKAEGPPGTRNGTKLQTATLAFLDHVVQIFDTAARGVGSLPTTSKKAFSNAGKAVIARFEAQARALQSEANALNRYQSKEIQDAVGLNPDCSGSLFGG
jgi:Tol biopolymer transport system component